MRTGICKAPTRGRVRVKRLGIEGDQQGDLVHHGGVDKAVYGYASEHYPYWRQQLARPELLPGQFGENLTVSGLDEARVCIGDRYRVGSATIEVSQPRLPCATLGVRMGDDGFVGVFLQSRRVGVYFRVLGEGEIGEGDAVDIDRRDEREMSITELIELRFGSGASADRLRVAATHPALNDKWRALFALRTGGDAETSLPDPK